MKGVTKDQCLRFSYAQKSVNVVREPSSNCDVPKLSSEKLMTSFCQATTKVWNCMVTLETGGMKVFPHLIETPSKFAYRFKPGNRGHEKSLRKFGDRRSGNKAWMVVHLWPCWMFLWYLWNKMKGVRYCANGATVLSVPGAVNCKA